MRNFIQILIILNLFSGSNMFSQESNLEFQDVIEAYKCKIIDRAWTYEKCPVENQQDSSVRKTLIIKVSGSEFDHLIP